MSDSVFVEEDGSKKNAPLDAVSPLSMESSIGGLEVFLEEEEDVQRKEQQSSGVSDGGRDTEQNGLSTIPVNGFRSVSVSPKPTNKQSTDENGKNNY